MSEKLRFESRNELVAYLRKEKNLYIPDDKIHPFLTWEPPYDEHDVVEVIAKFGKGRLSAWKKWVGRKMKQINQKEDLLWSRPRYQKDLDRLAKKWGIPTEGFTDSEAEDRFLNSIRRNSLQWSVLKNDIEQIVEGHSSSRLQLGGEWTFAVERHLLSRDKGRLAARLMVQMMAPPEVKIEWDRWGEPTGVRLIIERGIPEVVIREYKKDMKKLEEELGLKPKKRNKISHRRELAKKLYEKSTSEILLHKDIKLRQRYKRQVEG